MSNLAQVRALSKGRATLGIRMTDRPGWRQLSELLDLGPWPPIDLEMDFDQYVLACVLSRALEEIDAGEATATEATGLSQVELRDILNHSFPAPTIHVFRLEEVSDPEPGPEEELLRGLLLAHARAGDSASVRFAKIIARRALRHDHLWKELGLFDRVELSRLLATHFPTLAAGNTKNMRWKKYFYRKLCEAEGFSLCTAPSCQECKELESCFGPEEGESASTVRQVGGDLELKCRPCRL